MSSMAQKAQVREPRKNDVLSRTLEIFDQQMGLNSDGFTLISGDELDLDEIHEELQIEFNLNLSREAIAKCRTISDVVELIKGKL